MNLNFLPARPLSKAKKNEDQEERFMRLIQELEDILQVSQSNAGGAASHRFDDLADEQRKLIEILETEFPELSQTARELFS